MINYEQFLQGENQRYNLHSYQLLQGQSKNTFQKYAKRIYSLAMFYNIDEYELIQAIKEITKYDGITLHDLLFIDYKKAVMKVKRKNRIKDFDSYYLCPKISYDFKCINYLKIDNPYSEQDMMFYIHEILSGRNVPIDKIRALPKYKCWYVTKGCYISSAQNALMKICLEHIGQTKLANQIDLMYFFDMDKNKFSLGYNIKSHKFDMNYHDNTHDVGLLIYLLEDMDTRCLKSYFVSDYSIQILNACNIRGIGKVTQKLEQPRIYLREYSEKVQDFYLNVNGEWALYCDSKANISLYKNGHLEYRFLFAALDYHFDRASHGFFDDKVVFIFANDSARLVIEITNKKIRIVKNSLQQVYVFCNKQITSDFASQQFINIKAFKGAHYDCKYCCDKSEFDIPFVFGESIKNPILPYAKNGKHALVIFEDNEKPTHIKQCLEYVRQLRVVGIDVSPIVYYAGKPLKFAYDFANISFAINLQRVREECAFVVSKRLMQNEYFGNIPNIESGLTTFSDCAFPIKRITDRYFFSPLGLIKYNELLMSKLNVRLEDTRSGKVYSPIYTNSKNYSSGRMAAKEGVIVYESRFDLLEMRLNVNLQSGKLTFFIRNLYNKDLHLRLCIEYFENNILSEYVNIHSQKVYNAEIQLFSCNNEYKKIKYPIKFQNAMLNKYFSELSNNFICSIETLFEKSPKLLWFFYGFASIFFCPDMCKKIIFELAKNQTVVGNIGGGMNYLFCLLIIEYIRAYKDFDILKVEISYLDCTAKDSLKYHLLKAINMIPKTKTQKLLRYIALKKFIDNTTLIDDRAKILKAINMFKNKSIKSNEGYSVLYRLMLSAFCNKSDSIIYLDTFLDLEIACVIHNILGNYVLSKNIFADIIKDFRYFKHEFRNDALACIMLYHICKNIMGCKIGAGNLEFDVSNAYGYEYSGHIAYEENKIKIKRSFATDDIKINNIKTNLSAIKLRSDKGYVSVDIGC